jgi:hypothetical protein
MTDAQTRKRHRGAAVEEYGVVEVLKHELATRLAGLAAGPLLE